MKSSGTKRRVFWNACPKNLPYLPESPCPFGKASVESKDIEKGCPWYVNSEQDQYCFWHWIRRVSDKHGFMDPLLQSEISELINMSGTKIHATFKEAIEKIKTFEEYEELKELFEE